MKTSREETRKKEQELLKQLASAQLDVIAASTGEEKDKQIKIYEQIKNCMQDK